MTDREKILEAWPRWRCWTMKCKDYRKLVQPTERGTCPSCGKGRITAEWPKK